MPACWSWQRPGLVYRSQVLADNRPNWRPWRGHPGLERIKPPSTGHIHGGVAILTCGQARNSWPGSWEHPSQKGQLETRIAELEKQQQVRSSNGRRTRIAAELIDLRRTWQRQRPKIENNPKHPSCSGVQWGKDLGGCDETIISLMHDNRSSSHTTPARAKAFTCARPFECQGRGNYDLLACRIRRGSSAAPSAEDEYDRLIAGWPEEKLSPETTVGTWTSEVTAHSRTAVRWRGRRGLDHGREAHPQWHRFRG